MLEAELVAIHAVQPLYFAAAGGMYGVGYEAGALYRELQEAARKQLVELGTALRSRRVALRTRLGVGPAHQVIADAAKRERADLIIMSTHGRTGLSHAVMGSVAERVVRTAPCPVLTVGPRRLREHRRLRRVRSATPRVRAAARRLA